MAFTSDVAHWKIWACDAKVPYQRISPASHISNDVPGISRINRRSTRFVFLLELRKGTFGRDVFHRLGAVCMLPVSKA